MNLTYAEKKHGALPAEQPRQASAAQPVPAALPRVPNAAEASLRPVDLPGAIQAKMEASFGADLSAVKLYESAAVAEHGAQAVAQGNRIAFAPGALDFTSSKGQALLGHELSHVVSQAKGETRGSGFLNDAALEARADREGAMAAAGEQIYAGPVSASLSSASPASAAGPMQAKKRERDAKSKEEMLAPGFDLYGDATNARHNPSPNTGTYLFRTLYGENEDRVLNPEKTAANASEWLRGGDMAPSAFVNQTNNNQIRGNVFRPSGQSNGKHVILYSGSHGSNLDQMYGNIEEYLKQGYTVHSYDYGGFGDSTTPDGAFSERSMQEDAQAIFEHVRSTAGGLDNQGNPIGIRNRDIVLHGFSMGGPMAAHVARNAAIEATRRGNGRIDNDDKLSGLVLESSMRSTRDATEHMPAPMGLNSLAGMIGSTQGRMDTGATLAELSQLDPYLPLNIISANRGMQIDGGWSGDHLDDANTHLSEHAKNLFYNVQTYHSSNEDHMDAHKLHWAFRSNPALKNNFRR